MTTLDLSKELDGAHPLVAIATDDEESLRIALFNAVPTSTQLATWTAVRGLADGRVDSGMVPATEHAAAAFAYLASRADPTRTVAVFYDCSSYLTDARTLRALREAVARLRSNRGVVVLVDRDRSLPPLLEADTHRLEVPPASEEEIEQIAKNVVRDLRRTREIATDISVRDFKRLVRSLRGLTASQAERVIKLAVAGDSRLDAADLESVLHLKRNALGDLGGVLEFVRAPVSMDEVGGLVNLKAWLAKRQLASSAEAERFGVKPPRGVLMLGAQGAGKSLAAKAVATAWGVPLLRLDAGALYDKFVGESERKLRDTLTQADRMAPAVLWIDEIEKGFASASSLSSDGGLSRRMFATLLTWMQERTAPTFLAATANDISALPPELLRKGRFDEVFFVDLPSAAVRQAILGIHLRKRKRKPSAFDLATLARESEGFSGAELEAAVEAALHTAFADGARDLTTADLLRAIEGSPPLSHTMRERFAELRAWAGGRCVAADAPE